MKLQRIVIGVQLNKKIFRLASTAGLLIDELLDLRESDQLISDDYFTKVNSSLNIENMHISLRNDDSSHALSFQPAFVDLKISELSGETPISLENAYKEFVLFWKKADKILKFPAIRRVGIVVEFRMDEHQKHSASNDLMKALLKSDTSKQTGRFHLQYEDKDLKENGEVPNAATDDFWNTIFTFYSSDRDETPEDGKINANIDLQKYYNPAKSGPLAELRKVKEKLVVEKRKFKNSLKEMGFE